MEIAHPVDIARRNFYRGALVYGVQRGIERFGPGFIQRGIENTRFRSGGTPSRFERNINIGLSVPSTQRYPAVGQKRYPEGGTSGARKKLNFGNSSGTIVKKKMGVGQYAGKSRGRIISKRLTKFDTRGITAEYELNGSSEMVSTNWIGCQAYTQYRLIVNAAMSVLRYLLAKNGRTFMSASDYIDKRGNTRTGLIQISMQYYPVDGSTPARQEYNYTVTGSTSTLTDFGVWFYNTVFVAQPGGVNANAIAQPTVYNITYREYDTDATSAFTIVFSENMFDLNVSAYCHSHLVLQNATLSDSGNANTDVVDTNPLVGKVFNFSGTSIPVLRNNFLFTLQGTDNWLIGPTGIIPNQNTDGMLLPQSAVPTTPFNSVPDPSIFYRLRSCYSVNFQPGQSKLFKLSWGYKGSFGALMNKLQLDLVNANPRQTYGLGKCMVVAVENRVRGSANTKFLYHLDQYYGVVVTSRKRHIIPRTYETSNGRNVAPPPA